MIAVIICNGPDTSLQGWARPHALAELAEEDDTFAAYAADADRQAEVAAKLRKHGKHPDRCVAGCGHDDRSDEHQGAHGDG